jgi:hypothetical protein
MITISTSRAQKIARNINAMDLNYNYSDDSNSVRFWSNLAKKLKNILSALSTDDKSVIAALCEPENAKYFGLKEESVIQHPKTTQVLNYTQARLNNWYENAKLDFDVEGSAVVSYNSQSTAIEITYTENDITGKFELMYWQDQAIDWVFGVWSELANIENDKVA